MDDFLERIILNNNIWQIEKRIIILIIETLYL